MAGALTPEQLLQLYQLYQQNGFSTGQNIGGQYLAPVGIQGAGEDNGQNTLQGFTGFDPQMIADQIAQYGRIMPGTEGSLYGTGGGNSGSYTTQDDNPDGIQKLVLAAIIAASAGAASGAFGGAGAAGGAETGAGVSGMDLAADGGANSIFGSGGAAGFGGAGAGVDAYGTSGMDLAADGGANGIGSASSGMGGGAGAGANVSSTFNAAKDSALASEQLGLTAADTTAGGIPSVGGAGNTPYNPLQWGSSGIPDWAKLLAGGLGAAAGAQGTNKSTTDQKDIPDWLKPMVIGTAGHPGVLGYSQQLLDKQMQPGYLAGYDQMRSTGTQLMNTPQRGNGFNTFYPGMGGGAAPAAPAAPVPQPMATPGGWLGGAGVQGLAQAMPFRAPTGRVDQMFAGVNPNDPRSVMY